VVARLLAIVTLIAACSDRTELVLGAATDLKARNQLDEVKLVVTHKGKTVLSPPPWSLADVPAGKFELPGSFGLYSPDGSEVSLEIELTGSKGGTPLIIRKSILSLVSGKTLFMRMTLVSDCSSVDGPGCLDGQSCVEGVCRDQKMDGHTFPKYQKGMEARLECQSGFDYVVTSTGDPMPVVGDCGPGATCQEGVCYARPKSDADGGMTAGVWSPASAPNSDLLHAIWQTPDGQDVFAVGDAGTILHLHNGGPMAASAWIAEPSPVKANLYAIWGTSIDDVFVAGTLIGEGGILLHRSMGSWTRVMELTPVPNLRGIAGNSTSDFWLVGADSTVIHFDGSAFTKDASFTESTSLRAVSVAGSEVWVAGTKGVIGHFDGHWTILKVAGGPELHAIVGFPGEARAVGQGGVIAHAMGGAVSVENPSTVDLFGIATRGPSDLVVVGDYGTILRLGNGWAEEGSGTLAPLFAVWTMRSSTTQYAVGHSGTVLTFNAAACDAECGCGISGGSCSQPDCNGGMLTVHTCDRGSCVPVTPATPCPGVLACADAHSCANKCASDSECDTSAFCDANGNCSPRKDASSTGTCNAKSDCKDPASCRECKDGLTCVDGYCCTSTSCGGICQSCAVKGKEGTCSAVPDGTLGAHGNCSPYVCASGACSTSCNPAPCAPDATCNNIGGDGPPNYVCQKNQGAMCTDPATCRTGSCAQGTCCDTQCAVFCDAATANLYPSPTCATGTCTAGGTPTACANHLACSGTDACMTYCFVVWPAGTPLPSGLFTDYCAPGYSYCNCVPSTPGGNCTGTKCCTTYPCN
jgi:hypothetical protein